MKKSNNLIAIVLVSISISLGSCASHGGGCGYWSDVEAEKMECPTDIPTSKIFFVEP